MQRVVEPDRSQAFALLLCAVDPEDRGVGLLPSCRHIGGPCCSRTHVSPQQLESSRQGKLRLVLRTPEQGYEHHTRHSHEGSLCDNDVLGLAVLVDEPRVGLHPLPALVLGQQAEDRQAALPRSHHCREEARVQGPVSTSPEAGLPPATLPFPAGISGRVTAEGCPGWHMQGTPPWLDTPHCSPPRAPYSDKSITARHKAKRPTGKELPGLTQC